MGKVWGQDTRICSMIYGVKGLTLILQCVTIKIGYLTLLCCLAFWCTSVKFCSSRLNLT